MFFNGSKSMLSLAAGLAVFVCVLSNGVQPASAGKISLKACLKASAEKSALTAQGYESYFEHGPAWARANLTPAKLDGVKRLISLIEILEFRCNTSEVKARRKHVNSPAFRRWKALHPPLPRRNPVFAALKSR